MEAAARTAHYFVTGSELDAVELRPLRGLNGAKEARLRLGDVEVGVAVVSGLANARQLLDQFRAGRNDLHFVEVMTCPGGCIAGGGQPFGTDLEAVRSRMKALYKIDREETLRTSHNNPSIKRLYEEFLGEPLGPLSHALLHTHYEPRHVSA
jgi:NADH-quinone oxidoreductase subunit G/NADP-reducing hydrogenase subunit HndD